MDTSQRAQPPANAVLSEDSQAIFFIKSSLIMAELLALVHLPVVIFLVGDDRRILVRYPLSITGVLIAYLAAVGILTLITGWSVRWLTYPRFLKIQDYVDKHWLRMISGFTCVSIVIFVLGRLVTEAESLGAYPRGFGAFYILLVSASVVVIAGTDTLRRVARRFTLTLERLLSDFEGHALRFPGLRWPLALLLAGPGPALVGLSVGLVAIASLGGVWTHPLSDDAAAQIYLGQHVLHGGIPYRTLVYFHPVGRFPISWLWALSARATGVPIPYIARAINLATGIGLLIVVYAIGKKLTGRPLGGLLAVSVMLGFESLLEITVVGPNLRIDTALLIALALWLVQCKRWLWAGAFVILATLTWLPASVLIPIPFLVPLMQPGGPRAGWRAVLSAATGAIAILILTAAILSVVGVLDTAFRQTVGATLAFAQGNIVPEKGQGMLTLLVDNLKDYRRVMGELLRGDTVLVVAAILGSATIITTRGARRAFSSSSSSSLLLAGLAIGTALSFDIQWHPDLLVLLPALSPLGAQWFMTMIDVLDGQVRETSRTFRVALEWVVVGALLIYGLSDIPLNLGQKKDAVTLADQQRMAHQLDRALLPNQTVQSLRNPWYHTLSGRDNATRFMQIGPKDSRAHLAIGIGRDEVVQEMEAHTPIVVLISQTNTEISDWLEHEYEYVGSLYLEFDRPRPQDVYIRKGKSAANDEINTSMTTWPLQKQRP